jgi:hypothetical protein
MKELLLKLAAQLRAAAEHKEKTHAVKCAQAAQALLGLTVLRKKLGR